MAVRIAFRLAGRILGAMLLKMGANLLNDAPSGKPLDEQATAQLAQIAAQVAAQTVSQLTQTLAGQQVSTSHAIDAGRRSSESERHAELVRQISELRADVKADNILAKADNLREFTRLEGLIDKSTAKIDIHDKEDIARFASHSRLLFVGFGIMATLMFLVTNWQFIAKAVGH